MSFRTNKKYQRSRLNGLKCNLRNVSFTAARRFKTSTRDYSNRRCDQRLVEITILHTIFIFLAWRNNWCGTFWRGAIVLTIWRPPPLMGLIYSLRQTIPTLLQVHSVIRASGTLCGLVGPVCLVCLWKLCKTKRISSIINGIATDPNKKILKKGKKFGLEVYLSRWPRLNYRLTSLIDSSRPSLVFIPQIFTDLIKKKP